jgi:2-C-methyl-D-erythritol 4-phosphate cytidylyltransferase/2-C-methyl-D-erythritol 2,4-cyclodiphosphate synthase
LPAVYGGTSRQKSVFSGLSALASLKPKNILIHDAARPNITHIMITELLNQLNDYDGTCPALCVTDSLRKKDGTLIERDNLYRVQTPQAFNYQKIYQAHVSINAKKTMMPNLTDDIAVAYYANLSINFIKGSEENYKITYPEDLKRFKNEQEQSMTLPNIRTAFGYDVHRLVSGDAIILGGVHIPCAYKLKGHSDADVVLHAITDALLGTIAAQDIGYHFNPNNPQWKNADSKIFLKHAHNLIKQKNGLIHFIDVTIICEVPKISPYREQIQNTIASFLNMSSEHISIKATTTEKLGFTGRQEGIAAKAITTVYLL